MFSFCWADSPESVGCLFAASSTVERVLSGQGQIRFVGFLCECDPTHLSSFTFEKTKNNLWYKYCFLTCGDEGPLRYRTAGEASSQDRAGHFSLFTVKQPCGVTIRCCGSSVSPNTDIRSASPTQIRASLQWAV